MSTKHPVTKEEFKPKLKISFEDEEAIRSMLGDEHGIDLDKEVEKIYTNEYDVYLNGPEDY